jgi:phage terminase large subunit
MNITIPHNWNPRHYQLPIFKAFDSGVKRFVLRHHRRAGKDDVCLHIAAKAALTKVGNYWHMLPEYGQGRKAIWDSVNSHTGKRRIDEAFPLELRKRTNNQEMFIEFINGSTWQVVGSDRFDSSVGSAPVGIVFSEFALANPFAWDYLSPILEENGGFAFFISTVRGRNHFWKLGEYARDAGSWFFQDVNADESGVFTQDQLANILEQYQARRGTEEGLAIFRQEYYKTHLLVCRVLTMHHL